MVKNFTDIPTTDGQLVTTVDDSWFMEPLSPGSANVTYTYFPYLIASNLDPAEELKNIYSTYRQFETLGTLNFSVVRKLKKGQAICVGGREKTCKATHVSRGKCISNGADKGGKTGSMDGLAWLS
jgi:hypothetical protein